MAPATVHEREIVLHVEELANRGELSVDSVADIASRLSFILTPDEGGFLVKYVVWRLRKLQNSAL